MRLALPKQYQNKIVKAIVEFDLIEDGDSILVGLSGGKDSLFLVYALAILQKRLAIKFNLTALTIDLGFESNPDYSFFKEFCSQLEVPYYIKKTEIAKYILTEKANNPCAKCAFFRRGAMIEFMKEKGLKKIALGHHYDDAVETFLLSIIYSGQILTLQPKRFLTDNKIYIIRPIIYLREKKIKEAQKMFSFQKLKSPCPYDGKTKRKEVKEWIKDITQQKQLFYNLAAAMRKGSSIELWPSKITNEELAKRLDGIWK